jgi:hypothetical protein
VTCLVIALQARQPHAAQRVQDTAAAGARRLLRSARRGISQHKDSQDWDPRFTAGAGAGIPHTAAAAGWCLGNGAVLCMYLKTATLIAYQAQPATYFGAASEVLCSRFASCCSS